MWRFAIKNALEWVSAASGNAKGKSGSRTDGVVIGVLDVGLVNVPAIRYISWLQSLPLCDEHVKRYRYR